MDWFLTIGAGFLIWLLVDALSPLLHPVFRAAARLYRPPHGTAVLAVTWIAAVALTVWAFTRGESTPRLATAAAVLSVPIALLATLTCRDSGRAAQNRPPVQHTLPARLGALGRTAALLVALASAAAAALLWPPGRWDDLLGWIGCLSGAAVGAVASITGKVPAFLRDVFESPAPVDRPASLPRSATSDRDKPRVPQN
jgi:hypothetical protein